MRVSKLLLRGDFYPSKNQNKLHTSTHIDKHILLIHIGYKICKHYVQELFNRTFVDKKPIGR